MKVEKICIVGGGTSGWLTAAALVKRLPKIKVTIVESTDIPTIGVGESTLEQFRTFLDFIGISDEDWMAECDATYKTSIGFQNFLYNDERTVHYPFGPVELSDKENGFDDIFALSCFHEEFSDPLSFQKYYNNLTTVAESNKLFDDIVKYTAYHLDASKFARWLRDRICVGAVEHIQDTVKPVVGDNGIDCLVTKGGYAIQADLYIDCTGFKSVLLEQTLGVQFNEFDNLINNRAVVARVLYENKEEELKNYTNCYGLSSGWVWTTPLWTRMGKGYVYSDKFLSPEEAEKEFREHINAHPHDVECRHIEFRHGIHEKAWEKNVVAIGLSYGFLEPLESTGLLSTHEVIKHLVTVLDRRNGVVGSVDRDSLNTVCKGVMTGMSGFVAAHYYCSHRNDTPYWKHLTEEKEYEVSDFFLQGGWKTIFTGLPYIAFGAQVLPLGYDKEDMKKDLINRYGRYIEKDMNIKKNRWNNRYNDLCRFIDRQPTTLEYLRDGIYK